MAIHKQISEHVQPARSAHEATLRERTAHKLRDQREAGALVEYPFDVERFDLLMVTEVAHVDVIKNALVVVLHARHGGDRLRALEAEALATALKLGCDVFTLSLGQGAFSSSTYRAEPFSRREVDAARFLSDLSSACHIADPACPREHRGDPHRDRVARAQVCLRLQRDGIIGLHTMRVKRAVLAVSK